ncbi:MAG: FkbM family methyltransferase [Chloroflexi bacterium]|nr:FkbM family methyltransferase [Chloroflexota bacterium]
MFFGLPLRHLLWNSLYKLENYQFPGSWRIRKLILKYFFKDKYIKTSYLGHHIYVCPTHIMGKVVFEGGVYEPIIIKTIQTLVAAGFSFIDVGANIGLHTTAAAFRRINSDQIFISFEPQADVFSILEKNCLMNGLNFVDRRQEGVGDQDTFLTLNISTTHNQGRHSFLPRENTAPGSEVKVVTLDTLFYADDDVSSRDILMKIDAEGYEFPIIKGGVKWLSKVKSMAIICEISPDLMKKNNMAENELVTLIQGCGFTKFKIVEEEGISANSNTTPVPYNVIFYKGSLAETIISKVETNTC